MSDCLNKSSVIFYAETSVENLQGLTARERLKSIRLLTTAMFNEAAARQNHNRQSPHPIPQPQDFPDEYNALTNLSLSLSHSKPFTRMIMNAADRTVMDMMEKPDMKDTLTSWGSHTQGKRKGVLRQVIAHFVSACRALTDIPYTMPELEFFCDALDKDKNILQGYYAFTHINSKERGAIGLNEHRDAGFYQSVQSCRTALHEAVHAIDDQTGTLGSRDPAITRDYHYDARIARMQKEHGAVIPFQLDTPYRAQYHERLAYDADKRFGQKLRAALA